MNRRILIVLPCLLALQVKAQTYLGRTDEPGLLVSGRNYTIIERKNDSLHLRFIGNCPAGYSEPVYYAHHERRLFEDEFPEEHLPARRCKGEHVRILSVKKRSIVVRRAMSFYEGDTTFKRVKLKKVNASKTYEIVNAISQGRIDEEFKERTDSILMIQKEPDIIPYKKYIDKEWIREHRATLPPDSFAKAYRRVMTGRMQLAWNDLRAIKNLYEDLQNEKLPCDSATFMLLVKWYKNDHYGNRAFYFMLMKNPALFYLDYPYRYPVGNHKKFYDCIAKEPYCFSPEELRALYCRLKPLCPPGDESRTWIFEADDKYPECAEK